MPNTITFKNFIFTQAHRMCLGTSRSGQFGYRVLEWSKFREGKFSGGDKAHQRNYEELYIRYKKGEITPNFNEEWIIEVSLD